jgi:hypothetical protein
MNNVNPNTKQKFAGEIPLAVFKKAKLFAVEKGITQNKLYEEAIVEYTEKHKDEEYGNPNHR